MISIFSHGVAPEELLARRLTQTRGAPPVCAEAVGRFGAMRGASAGDEVIPPGRGQGAPRLLVAGSAGEVRDLGGGRRQILRLRLPGDLLYACDREAVVALGRVRVVDAAPFLERLDAAGPGSDLRRSWLALAQAEQELLREQIVRLGRLTALERVAHALLEIRDRLAQVGLATGQAFQLPATQEQLSDLVGLSVVHFSRTLQALRKDGLLRLHNGVVECADRGALEAICGWRAAPAQPAAFVETPPRVAAQA